MLPCPALQLAEQYALPHLRDHVLVAGLWRLLRRWLYAAADLTLVSSAAEAAEVGRGATAVMWRGSVGDDVFNSGKWSIPMRRRLLGLAPHLEETPPAANGGAAAASPLRPLVAALSRSGGDAAAVPAPPPGVTVCDVGYRIGPPPHPLTTHILLHVGRLDYGQGIESLRDVIQSVPGARLALVGEGPARGDLEEYFTATPTTFLGHMSDADLG